MEASIDERSPTTVPAGAVVPAHLDRLYEGIGVIRHGELFAVFDRHGDAVPSPGSGHGFYYDGTRYLSGLTLTVEGMRPALLGSTVRDRDGLLTVDLANPELVPDGGLRVARDTIHIFRSRFACDDTFYETVRATNHGSECVEVDLRFEVAADFADIFEVRGIPRPQRGELLPPRCGPSGLELAYVGLDGRLRKTVLECRPQPERVRANGMSYRLRLEPKQMQQIQISVTCQLDPDEETPPARDERAAFARACAELDGARERSCRIRTSNEAFNEWIARSMADVHMMISRTEHGIYPYAGVPWFNAVFGRDGIITARELLWADPAIARGVLATLAGTQARRRSERRDADPGKIVHEIRGGEMASLGEVPFGCYYGTVDATPLFVVLARDYTAATGDTATLSGLWPSVRAALEWMDRWGDLDGDGFIEYGGHVAGGLVQQGWKDSDDSVFHEDGRLAEGPIALCEVQGYAYAARLAAAEMADLLGDAKLAQEQRARAEDLRRRFLERFWLEDLGTFALALDGEKEPCRVRTSNAGQCLWTGIATPEQGRILASTLMTEESFSGWGIRTVAASERRYNPMAYHNGSVWPHDTAIVAAGMARYGRRRRVLRLLDGLFHASSYMELARMPELLCGFHARPGQGPTLYPMACAPQAWAAGSVFLLIEACLGLEVHGASHTLLFRRPLMPAWLDWIEMENLSVGGSSADLLVRRVRSGATIEILRRSGPANVQLTHTM
ncbi:MAG TPA: glycogen debranching N-terminal domain-containing protein [Longimicrobiales bacterium]|nr:glycogen debranching N-terminal domain-containing protein [Longimicrobiales bacterium]